MIRNVIGPITRQSSVYESSPWGFEAETPFLNQVLCLKTTLGAEDILQQILAIENEMGRKRSVDGYISRTIDVDILYYGQLVMENDRLTIPHPRMHLRRFTMLPMVEVAGNIVHPKLSLTNSELLLACNDKSTVSIVNLDE